MAKPEKTQQDKFDALYQWLSYELQQARDALMTEVRMSSAQIGSLYSELKNDSEKTSATVAQEIRYSYKQNQTIYDGLASMLTKEVGERLNAMDEKLAALEQLQVMLNELNEIKYSYMHLQGVCSNLTAIVSNEVNPKLDVISAKQALLDQIEGTINEINAKLEGFLPTEEDYKKLAEEIAEKTESSVATHTGEVLEAVAAIPVAENVDYNRIVEEVGDKLLDILNQIKSEEVAPEQVEIDYDKIVYGTAEKVVESLPCPEKVDYSRIEEAVASKINMEALAEAVAAKIVIPEVDYERLADLVVEKLTGSTEQTCEVILDDAGIDEIAAKVADKLAPEAIDYDKIGQLAQAAQVMPEPVDYNRIAEIVEDKLSSEEPTYDLVIDEEGISAIAKGVSEEICQMCASCELEYEEAPVEEAVEEPVEETVEEVVEETVEEVIEEAPVEEVVEEPVEETVEEEVVEEAVEEVVEEAPVEEELAATSAPVYEEVGNDLVDAETGLVIRLKRSFTAKMAQSEERVKGYYSDIKNELTSFKKIHSNVSWHGDRFNLGRDTIAKMNINGKTLCFYLALDPNDPELKFTVYHQKDVGMQKAYESTPFMVKVKSDAAAKNALRLVGLLAEKLGAQKKDSFETVDYVEEFAYQSTKQLFDQGFIKASKEKKVDFSKF